jgi:uncharacterized membrane protein YfcA
MEILAGFLIALAIGMTGIGAGSITAPVLILFFAQPAAQAVTIALVFGTVVKMIAAPIYLARGQINFRILAYLAAGGLPGVLVGSLLLASMDKAALNEPVLIIVGFTIVFSAAATLMRSLANRVVSKPIKEKWLSLMVAPIGLEVGFSSAGAGALGSVALMRYTSLLPAQVIGTDLAFGLVLSLFGGSIHAGMTGLPTEILTKMLIGGVPGVLLGTQLATTLSPKKMRLALCVWLLYVGIQLSYRGITGMVEAKAKAAAIHEVQRSR